MWTPPIFLLQGWLAKESLIRCGIGCYSAAEISLYHHHRHGGVIDFWKIWNNRILTMAHSCKKWFFYQANTRPHLFWVLAGNNWSQLWLGGTVRWTSHRLETLGYDQASWGVHFQDDLSRYICYALRSYLLSVWMVHKHMVLQVVLPQVFFRAVFTDKRSVKACTVRLHVLCGKLPPPPPSYPARIRDGSWSGDSRVQRPGEHRDTHHHHPRHHQPILISKPILDITNIDILNIDIKILQLFDISLLL